MRASANLATTQRVRIPAVQGHGYDLTYPGVMSLFGVHIIRLWLASCGLLFTL